MKQYKIFVIANLIFGILLIVLTKMILPVCHPMGGGVRQGFLRKRLMSFFLCYRLWWVFLFHWYQQ